MSVYNKNRDYNKSLHDEIKEQKSKMKGQPLKVKVSYFLEYYLKTTIVILLCAGMIISVIVSILSQPEDTVFAGYFINNTGSVSDTTLINGFIEEQQIDTKEHEVYLDTSIFYDPNSTDQYAYVSIQKIMAIIASGELDVIVGDETVAKYYGYGDCYLDISKVLPEDLQEQFADRYYYYTNEAGETFPIGVYVDDSPKIEAYGYYQNVEPIYGIIANSNNVDNAIAFLRYLYEAE